MIRSRHLATVLAFVCITRVAALAAPRTEREVPREILALYNSRDDVEARDTKIHRIAEMPLNHLGLTVSYRDINAALPAISEMKHVRGVLTWFLSDSMPNPKEYLAWSEAVIDAGKKFVILGDPGFSRDYRNQATPMASINRLLAKLGLRSGDSWTRITYDVQFVYRDPHMVEFERALTGVLPPFDQMKKIDARAKSYLVARRGTASETESHLVVIGPNGGYVAGGYTHYANPEVLSLQLHINPFEFFRLAFETDALPKPDTTTLSGRRIFYSHIDGDGWRNMSEIGEYKRAGALSAEVVMEKVIQAFPDLPVTVGPVVADLDPTWYGTPKTLELARRIFSFPHVEAASHTYSHPLNWEFFLRNDFAKEQLQRKRSRKNEPSKDAERMRGHEVARTYAASPFKLQQEIQGSISFINGLLPRGKRVELLQWSGDTMPFEEAVAATRAAGVRNINGGDTRYDPEYPSYAWVSPLGRQVGRQWQIYASNSNENTYTDMWTDRYFGFKELMRTVKNTEIPRRIKPINIYYHMYSGQKQSSLDAVLQNLRYVRSQEITPITTGTYAAIADGFYQTRIIELGERSWRIENRGALQTIRFERRDSEGVDFGRSKGVIGQRHYQGSLYVALDAAEPAPVITLRNYRNNGQAPDEKRPYLIHSRWQVSNVGGDGKTLSFTARGFGRGEMLWKVPDTGSFLARVTRGTGAISQAKVLVGKDRLLSLALDASGVEPVRITIAPLGSQR